MSRRAVSPVIGVTLLLAITVVLAAVIGVFVIGVGGQQNDVPSAAINAELMSGRYGDTKVVLTHEGGDVLDASELRAKVLVDGTPLKNQLDIPSSGGTGFLGAPSGPFNARSNDKNWTAGETGSFTIAGTNSPQPTADSVVTVKIYSHNELITSAKAYN